MTETVSAPWGNDDEPESVMYALSIAGMGTPFTDYQGTLYGNPRYWPDGTSCAEFKDYGLARAVRVLCNNADAIKAALSTPPQNTDGEATGWAIANEFWMETTDKAKLAKRIDAALSAMKAERDALLADSTDKAQAWDAIAEKNATIAALKSDLTRYIDIATKEATEAESLRAERDALAKEVRQWRAAFNAAFPAKPTLQGDAK